MPAASPLKMYPTLVMSLQVDRRELWAGVDARGRHAVQRVRQEGLGLREGHLPVANGLDVRGRESLRCHRCREGRHVDRAARTGEGADLDGPASEPATNRGLDQRRPLTDGLRRAAGATTKRSRAVRHIRPRERWHNHL